ncbi:MAG: protein kinase, partial [Acidobacteriota bacterium]
DIMMPGIDGVEVLKILRQKHSQVELPIIMATAKADSNDMVEALDHGANDYVIKPLDFRVVLARVQAQLRTKAAAPAPAKKDGEPTLAELEPGVVLAGKYRLEEHVGAGTFGAVYRAKHVELDRDVAVKILQPSVTANDESSQRFQQEGVAACRVEHPNAVAVLDYGVTETEVAYLVMELLRGAGLDAEIRSSFKLTPQRCLQILGPVCSVLAEAHEAGLVHRDIKPENIFLHRTPRGEEVKVLDFGIAKLVGESVSGQNLTAEGWVLGTPAYMAPERIASQDLTGKADVYSLGIMLFEMLTGKRPFVAHNRDPMSMIMMHVNNEAPTLRSVDPNLPEVLEGVVAAAILKDPEERPDARALALSLERAVAAIDGRSVPEPAPIARSEAPSLVTSAEVDLHAPTISFADSAENEVPATAGQEGLLGRWIRRLRQVFS